MTRVPRVLISLVNWNGGAQIARCLAQLRLQTFPHARVIVVDNGSTDGSIEAIRQMEPGLIIRQNSENLGYAGAHNVAIRYGLREGFDYFWLLNFDTILEPGTLAALVASAESDRTVGAISPVVFKTEQPERIQFCGTWMEVHQYSFRNARDLSELDARQSSGTGHLLLWGTALLVSREAIQAVGLLDERYFAYYEDLDLTDRIHTAGFRNRVSPDARIWHTGVNSVRERPPYYAYFNVRNYYLFWCERPAMANRLRHWRRFTMRTLSLISELKESSGPVWIDAAVCGFRDALLGRYGAWDERRTAPRWLYALLTAHPNALRILLEGRVFTLLWGTIKACLKKMLSRKQIEELSSLVDHEMKVLNTIGYQVRNIFLPNGTIKKGGRNNGKVSIIIPTLCKDQHAHHLPMLRRLLSEYLPNQSHKNYEAIVYCDGPNRLVEEMVIALNDSRIKVCSTATTLAKWGHPQTRMGIAAAAGNFFVRMNDDNKPYKNYLQTLINSFEEEDGLAYGRVVFKGEARRAHRASLVHSFVIPGDKIGELRLRNIDCMNYMIRMDIARQYVDSWDDGYGADWNFVEAMLKNGVKARFCDKIIGEKF